MPTCHRCTAYIHPECQIYNRTPPPGYAAKCRKYIEDASREEPEPEAHQECKACVAYESGYCLRTDHPDWRYNFVKIKPDTPCRLEE